VSRAESDRAIQILLDRLRLRSPDKLYRCPGTGTLWPRTILDWAPLRGCLGSLQEITHAEADEDRRWGRAKRELRGSDIDGMARMKAEGHSLRNIAEKLGVGYGTVRIRLAASERKTSRPKAAAMVEM
jgi:lambda repressor-like predicted transcriptional regulator